MNVNPKISFPPECEFALVSPFIREVCRVAYAMQALDPPLDIPLATDGELMSETKYDNFWFPFASRQTTDFCDNQ